MKDASSTPGPQRPSALNLTLVLVLAALGSEPSAAQQGPEGAQDSQVPPSVFIIGDSLAGRSFDVPASVDVIDRDALRHQQPGVNLSEALSRVPGLVIQNRQNFAQDLQVSSRGFGARATFGVRGVRLLQDGIPLTMPDGQGQTALFDLDGVDHVEVIRGPFAALYGNSSGGVVHLVTADGKGPPQAELSLLGASAGVSAGSWRTGLRVTGSSGAWAYAASAARFHTQGWREHSAATRDSSNLRLRWTSLDGATLTLLASGLKQPDTQDPLGLTREQLAADRRQAGANAVAFNTRKSIDHRQTGLVYKRPLGDGSSLQAMVYGGDRRVVQFLAIPLAAQGPTSSGGVVDLDREFGGAGLQWRHAASWLGRPFNWTLGLNLDSLSEIRTGYQNVSGVQGDKRRDETDRVRSRDAFALADWQLSDSLRVSAGVRHSDVAFTSDDRYVTAVNPDDSGRADYRRASPVLGAMLRLRPELNLFASVGRGFETPTFAEIAYRPGGQPGLNFDLAASVSSNAELGLKGTPLPGVRGSAALFRAETRDDIVSAGASGGRTVFANAGRTRREGIELGADAVLGRHWTVQASYTHNRAVYRSLRTAAGSDLSGARVAGVPAHVLHGELAWAALGNGWSTALELHAASRIFANDANTAAAPGYGVLNWRGGWAGRIGAWRLEAFARVENLLDRDYVGSVIVNEANLRFFEPAPGRALALGARAAFGF